MGTKAFEVYGEIGLKGGPDVKRQLGDATDEAKKAESGFSKSFKGIAAAAATYLTADLVIDFAKESVTAFSNLNEATTKSQAVFGDLSAEVEDFASTAAYSIGQAESVALDATATFGNLLIAFGTNRDAAADMSVEMVKLASDLASFNNTSVDEAITALRSGLSGEMEPLKRYGVALTDARLKAVALDEGLIETASGTLPANVRAMAAYKLILEDTALAQGDFERTSEGLANQQRINAALWEDTKAGLGEWLAVPVNATLEQVNARIAAQNAGVDEVNQTWYRYLGPVGSAIAVLNDWNDSVDAGRIVLRGNSDALTDSWQLQAERNSAVETASRVQRDYTASLLETEDALNAQDDAELALLIAQERVEQKQQALTDAIDEHGQSSRDARIAELELAQAEADAAAKADEFEAAQRDVVDAQAAVANNKAALDALGKLERAYNDLAHAASNANGKMQTTSAVAPDRVVERSANIPTKHGGGGIQVSGMYSLRAGEHVLNEEQVKSLINRGGSVTNSAQVIILADPRYTDTSAIERDFGNYEASQLALASIASELRGG